MSPSSASFTEIDERTILEKWPEVTPLRRISGIPTSPSSENTDKELFKGHDEEQIKLMDELCIVTDVDDVPVGAGTKRLCHLMDNIKQGLLHRAFSVFLFDENDRLLLQERAEGKITFPEMWTNTCCSHPLCVPEELGVILENKTTDVKDIKNSIEGAKIAAQRKLNHELGIPFEDVPLSKFHFLTRIHYMATSGSEDSPWGEHEIDYILLIRVKNGIRIKANHNEVKNHKFVSMNQLHEMFQVRSLNFTPWFKLICQSFLFNWWANLDSIEDHKDNTIHRLL